MRSHREMARIEDSDAPRVLVTSPAGARPLPSKQVEPATNRLLLAGGSVPELPCTPRRCELGSEPHEHCVCGLPMALRAACCHLCAEEGLDLEHVVACDDSDPWDGSSRPSRRRRPRPGPNPLGYVVLLSAVLNPGGWDGGIAQRWARSRSWAA